MRNAKTMLQDKMRELSYLMDFNNSIEKITFNDIVNPYDDVECFNIGTMYTIHYSNNKTRTFDSYDTLLMYLTGCIDGIRAVEKKDDVMKYDEM